MAQLTKEVIELKASNKPSSQAPTVVQNLKTTNMVVNDAKEREPRSKNIVIRGIKPLENDQQDKDAVNKFFEAVSEEKVTVKKVQRLFKAKNDMRNKSEPTSSILVCFDNRDEQQKALKAARQHSNPSYEGVFAHEDRTKAQLLE